MEKAVIQKQVQVIHPEKIYYYLPNLTDATLAPLFGLSTKEYKSTKALFATRVAEAAERLMTDHSFRDLCVKLPFKKNDIVVVLGESNTDDYQSWFEILKTIVTLNAPEKNIRMINSAISGQTTTMALRNLTTNLQVKPSWVFCMLGMNDTLRIGGKNSKTAVSLEETKRNLDFMYNLTKQVSNPQWVWMTPYTIDELKQNQNQWFKQLQLKWHNEDLNEIAEYLLSKKDTVVDLRKLFTNNDEKLLMEDGIHASLEGHIQIAKELVTTLSEFRI